MRIYKEELKNALNAEIFKDRKKCVNNDCCGREADSREEVFTLCKIYSECGKLATYYLLKPRLGAPESGDPE